MSVDAIARIEQVRGHKFSDEEAARLREIGGALNLRPDDPVWDMLAAMEYQRTFYDELPGKIAATSTAILEGITTAADKEAAAAQARLTDCVVEQAKRLSTKINYATLLPMGMAALVCLLGYGSLLLWAGFCIGSGQAQPLALWLRMPSGFLMAGLCLAAGLFVGVQAGREFAEGNKGLWKQMFVALAMVVIGATLIALTL